MGRSFAGRSPRPDRTFAVALGLAIALVLAQNIAQRLTALAAGSLFVAVVAFSRMYLGVHYLSDVLASVPISSAGILAWLPVWNHLIAPRISRIHLIQRFEARAFRPRPPRP